MSDFEIGFVCTLIVFLLGFFALVVKLDILSDKLDYLLKEEKNNESSN